MKRTYWQADIYKQTLRLYPSQHQQSYADDMSEVFDDMLAHTSSRRDRTLLLFRSIVELIPWIVRDHTKHIVETFGSAPLYLRRSLIASASLLLPFIFIDVHNEFQRKVYGDAPSALFQTIGHYGIIYTLLLPMVAFGITTFVGLRYAKQEITVAPSFAMVAQKSASIPMLAVSLLGLIELHVLF